MAATSLAFIRVQARLLPAPPLSAAQAAGAATASWAGGAAIVFNRMGAAVFNENSSGVRA